MFGRGTEHTEQMGGGGGYGAAGERESMARDEINNTGVCVAEILRRVQLPFHTRGLDLERHRRLSPQLRRHDALAAR